MITSVATKVFFGKLADKKKGAATCSKDFLGKKAQSNHLDHLFLYVTSICRGLQKKFCFSLSPLAKFG
jgi:hypothetical protein